MEKKDMKPCLYCGETHEAEHVYACRELWFLQFADLLAKMTPEELAEFTRDLRAELQDYNINEGAEDDNG